MQTLQDSELRYRRLFEAAQDGILMLDARTGMITDVNPFLINMLGYSREEFVEKKLWEVGAFKDIEASQDAFKALQENEYIRYENLPLKAKDGRLIQVEFVSNVYLVGNERVIQCNIRDVTERKQSEHALRGSEEKYRLLFENNPHPMWVYDLKTLAFLTVNDAAVEKYGYTCEEFLHMTIADIRPMEDVSRLMDCLARQRPAVVHAGEWRHRLKDGTIINVEVTSQVLRMDEHDSVFVVAQDITERKQAEEALRESEERYRLLLETLPNGVVVHSQGRIVFANPASATIIGAANLADLIGKPVIEFVHPDYRELALKRIQQSLSEGSPASSMEEVFIRLDGTPINVEISAFPFLYTGKPAMLSIFMDITERKQREEQMSRLNMAVNNSSEAIFMTNREGVITFVNPGFTQLYGYTVDEIVGKTTPRILKSGAMKSEDYAAFWRTLLNKQVAKGELTNKIKDGALLNIESWSSPILNQMDEVIGFLSLQRDITERKRAEEALILAHSQLTNLHNNLPEAIFSVDLIQNKMLQVSPAHEAVFGYSREEFFKNPQLWYEIIIPEDKPIVDAGSPTLFAGKILQQQFRILRPDGETRWIGAIIKPTLDENGKLVRVDGIASDITERKQSEERIRRQLEHLTALSAIDRVIASNFDLNLCLSEILTHVTIELGIDAADILLFDSNSQTLNYGAECGFRTKIIKKTQIRLGESYAGRAALERKLVQIPNLIEDPGNLLLATLLADEEFVCYYGVPLIARGQVKGVLEVFNRIALQPDEEWFDFLKTMAGQAAIAIENAMLFENLQRSNSELALAYDATIEGWSRALDLRDKETEGHTQRVTEMTVKLARAFGLSESELVQVRWGALLHDIGKMGVPDRILLKPEPLTDEEWVAMKKHPALAYEMLAPIRYLRLALDIPYCHHEKWDGTGYPQGLSGTQIPLAARIFAVVDVWDALSSDRPYRAAWTKEKVNEHIRASSGTHFDPQVVDIFMQIPH